ncbi:MAG TPA: DUF58 domain-containing protein [Ktedonobacterales bacterium]|nr:DUF58 domain-containing protein [Ktedonobacterales bacterium]
MLPRSPGVDQGAWLSDEQLRSRRPWYWVAFALVIASALFRQPLIFIAGLLALALAVIPELWYRFCLSGLVYRRQLGERRVFFGETITLRLSVENRKVLPLPWLEVEDEFPELLTLQGGKLEPHFKARRMLLATALSLWWFQRVSKRYQIHCVARGVFTLGPVKLRSGDPFGLLTREQRFESLDTLLVYPPILPIERFGLPSRHPFGEQNAPRRLLEDPLRVVGARDWLPGDDLRRVHWKATARAMTLQSKVYEPTTTWTLALFVNVNGYANPALGVNPSLLDLTLTAAASLAAWAAEQGYATGLFSNGMQALTEVDDLPAASAKEGYSAAQVRLPPSSRPEQLPRVLETLARLIPFWGSPIEELFLREQTRLPAGTTIVLVSTAASVTPVLLEMLLLARARGHAVALLLAGGEPVEAPGLLVYRLGAEEVWHDIVAQAKGRDDSQGAESSEAGYRFILA